MVDAVLAQRLRVALDLADVGVSLMRQNLRRRYPDASPERVEQLLRDWINRREGDCPGPLRTLPGA
ncbi:MAG: hypothetical protein ACRD0K_00055 [Egibacteraceae bacterium]